MHKSLAMVKVALCAMLWLFAGLAVGHGGPNHQDDEAPITQREAVQRADRVIVLLMKSRKLPAEWQERRLTKATVHKTPEGLTLWSLGYERPGAKGQQGHALYILVDQFGNYIGTREPASSN